MNDRCRWCGCFVAKGTAPTAWRVPVGVGARQNPRSKWNYWARVLCPSCATCTNVGCWERTTLARVLARRGPEAAR
jgi:hypothetical protein